MRPFGEKPFEESCDEVLSFSYGRSASYDAKIDTVFIPSPSSTQEKLIFSHAIARSTKCHSIEAMIEKIIKVDNIPEYFQSSITSFFRRRKDVNQLSFQKERILYCRDLLNLKSRLLEPPEYLWESSEQTSLFEHTERAFDVKKRMANINRKLDTFETNLDVVLNHLTWAKGMRISWVIAFLILTDFFVMNFLNL